MNSLPHTSIGKPHCAFTLEDTGLTKLITIYEKLFSKYHGPDVFMHITTFL